MAFNQEITLAEAWKTLTMNISKMDFRIFDHSCLKIKQGDETLFHEAVERDMTGQFVKVILTVSAGSKNKEYGTTKMGRLFI